MNFGVMFLPIYRASTTAFLLGLGVFAALDAMRLSVEIPLFSGWIGMLAIWFFVYSLHANRRRHAGQETGLAFLPLGVAILGKMIGAMIVLISAVWQYMLEFASRNGVDVNDPEALGEAVSDPGFQEAMQAEINANPEVLLQWTGQASMMSWLGFWLVIALFSIWFANMKKSGGSIESA